MLWRNKDVCFQHWETLISQLIFNTSQMTTEVCVRSGIKIVLLTQLIACYWHRAHPEAFSKHLSMRLSAAPPCSKAIDVKRPAAPVVWAQLTDRPPAAHAASEYSKALEDVVVVREWFVSGGHELNCLAEQKDDPIGAVDLCAASHATPCHSCCCCCCCCCRQMIRCTLGRNRTKTGAWTLDIHSVPFPFPILSQSCFRSNQVY